MAANNTPRIEFIGKRYAIGNSVGYYPAHVSGSVQIVKDLPFMNEVVERRRLSMSATELLHAIQTVIEVGPELVAEDGQPRAITGLVKFDRTFKGKLEAANSGWNETCHCLIKAKLFSGTTREITDAEFRNVNAAVKAKVTNVIYDGASTGSFVVKGEKNIVAQGTNMMFIATGADADLAVLTVAGQQPRTLTCVESDAGKAVFAWPAGLTVNDGDAAVLYIRSHAGIEGNDDTVNTKDVVCLAADPTVMTASKATSELGDNLYCVNTAMTVVGTDFPTTAKVSVVFTDTNGDTIQRQLGTEEFASSDNGTKIAIAGAFVPSIATIDPSKGVYLVVQKDGSTAKTPLMTYREA